MPSNVEAMMQQARAPSFSLVAKTDSYAAAILCTGASTAPVSNNGQGTTDKVATFSSVPEYARAGFATRSFRKTTIRGDPGSVRRPSHSASTPSWSISATIPTIRSALFICPIFPCACFGTDSTSTLQPSPFSKCPVLPYVSRSPGGIPAPENESYQYRHDPHQWETQPCGAAI